MRARPIVLVASAVALGVGLSAAAPLQTRQQTYCAARPAPAAPPAQARPQASALVTVQPRQVQPALVVEVTFATGLIAPGPARDAESAQPEPYRMTAQTLSPTEILAQHPLNPRGEPHSSARLWNEMLIFAIRRDLARPTMHARNLYQISAAQYDAWAAYDAVADQVLHHEKITTATDIEAERAKAIAYATARLIQHRFQFSPGAFEIYPEVDALLLAQGYDPFDFGTDGDGAAALGNRIAQTCIDFGYTDGSNEANGYTNQHYVPVNPPLLPDFPGNPDMINPNRWQPLALDYFIDQNGNPIPGGYPPFLSAEWGNVTGFALRDQDLQVFERDGHQWPVYHDRGRPAYLGEPGDIYRWGFELVSTWSSHLDPTDGVMWDISPNSIGRAPFVDMDQATTFYDRVNGGVTNLGYDLNPVTGQPYPLQIVPRGDYTRILAEFWADGPASETPPGHWYTILNYVIDHPLFERRFMGQGSIVDALEFDVKSYLALGASQHDVGIACWGAKGYYDYLRPVSAIRYVCQFGQCSDYNLPSYHPGGVNLIPGLIELVTPETTAPGQRHEHLAGSEGKIAVKAWRGPTYIVNPDTDVAGVGWILADNWWPYQRPSFVTPPFAGYMSGHSTFSRGAAEVMTLLTGSEYFPGGLGEFVAPQNEFLVFEDGPSVEVILQWASYRDASDQCSLSRIWGGIHPPQDDLPGRQIGKVVGIDAFHEARRYFNGQISCPADFSRDNAVSVEDVPLFVDAYLAGDMLADMAAPYRTLNFFDVSAFLQGYAAGCP